LGSEEIASWHLPKRLLIKAQMWTTKTPKVRPLLQLAVDTNAEDMVKLLLENKANVKARDKYGLTAYVYALKKGNPEIVKLIKEAGGKY
jgi:hypothetical protein